jgi:tetratricopeptide (TPR) repeat protein
VIYRFTLLMLLFSQITFSIASKIEIKGVRNTINFENKVTKLINSKNEKILQKSEKNFNRIPILIRINNILNSADSLLDNGKMDSAMFLVYLVDSLMNLKSISNDSIQIRMNSLFGYYYYSQGNNLMARNLFKSNFDYGIKKEWDSLTIVSLKSIGNTYFIEGEYIDALKYYLQALNRIKILRNPSQLLLSSILQNIGITYSMLNDNDSAFKYLNISLDLKKTLLKEDDPFLASGYLNISRLLQVNGELNEAIKYIDLAERIYLKLGRKSYNKLAPLYLNKGSILLTLNDFDEALHYHELALDLYKSEKTYKEELIADIYLNFGIIYSNLNRIEDAIKSIEKSLILENTIEQKIQANLLLGICYSKLGKHGNARNKFLVSIELAEKDLANNSYHYANTMQEFGIFCEQTNDYNKALKYYLKAANTYKEIFGEKSRDLSNTYTLMGNYYLNLKKTDEALYYFQKALISYIPDYSDSVYFDNPEDTLLEPDLNLFYSLAGKSRALYQNYLLDRTRIDNLFVCIETLELSINLFEKIRSNLYSENTKLIIAERVNEIYNLATTVAHELYLKQEEFKYLEYTFRFSEKSKAAVLLSTIKENEAIMIGNIPETTILKEKNLKKQINQYQNILFEENQIFPVDSSKITRIRNNLFELKISYDSLISSLEKNYPEYYNLKYNNEVVTIKKVKDMLSNESHALIEYKIIDSALFTFMIRKDTAFVIKSEIDSSFLDKINTYYTLIGNLPQVDNAKSKSYEFAKLGFAISELLHLNHSSLIDVKRITIIPDDIIGYLSFDALLSNMPNLDRSSYRSLDYLIKKFTFSYGYSATLFFNNGFNRKDHKKKVLAIAPSYDNLTDSDIAESNSGIRDLAKYLTPLPNAITEVQQVTAILDGDAFIGPDATEKKFKESLDEYGILHFAMHTLINDEEPLASKLIFTLDQDTLNDGFLNTYEIYNLDLNAELAVLSACKTGIGKMRKGEGIMSLARGFLYAGVPGIIMTLWAVEDIASANIISDFYRNLSKGEPKDIAIRNAKLTFLENADQFTAHPYFWAAYVQIGDKDPIKLKNNFSIPLLGSLLSLVLIFLTYILLKRRSSKRTEK